MSDVGAQLMRMVNGYQVSQALHVVAVLRIADRLAAGPRRSDDLAAAAGVHADTLYRLLRALAAVGVFEEQGDQTFSLTPLGEGLRSDAPMPAGPWAEHIGRPYAWQAWAGLLHSVQTGQTAFSAIHGTTAWAYRAAHPDDGAVFDRAMTGLSRDVAAGVAESHEFSPFARVVDVGGGHGALIGAILAANPALSGVLFDQPHVVRDAAPTLAAFGVEQRCEVVGGDFFKSVPAGDLLLLKAVLHDWGDAEAAAILRTCRTALAPDGRVLVLERVVAGPNDGPETKFADLNMLVNVGGRERTATEFGALFAAAGLQLTRILPTRTRMSLIEAAAASRPLL